MNHKEIGFKKLLNSVSAKSGQPHIVLIETTLHVHKNVMNKLNEGIEKTGISRSSIIKLLIEKIMHDGQRMIKAYSRIKYQGRDEKENWNRLHIGLNEYEYEYYLDMRKFYKMSVSLILAYAVTRYLNELVNELLHGNKSADNYFYRNYIFVTLQKVSIN